MIPVSKIPTKLVIDHWTYGGAYISNNSHGDVEFTWYLGGKKDTLDPHFSVVKAASDYTKDQGMLATDAGLVTYRGNSAEVQQFTNGLDGSPGSKSTKMWLLRKFHISVPLDGGNSQANGHIFYRVTSAQHVEHCGDNRNHLRGGLRDLFIKKADLVNTWHALATGFYQAAIQGYHAPNASVMSMTPVLPPPTVTVGPQTSAVFDSSEGL